MILTRIKKGDNKKHYKCEVCGVKKKNAPYYMLSPHPAIIKLLDNFKERTACHLCAMREEFGNSYKQNKRYKEWESER